MNAQIRNPIAAQTGTLSSVTVIVDGHGSLLGSFLDTLVEQGLNEILVLGEAKNAEDQNPPVSGFSLNEAAKRATGDFLLLLRPNVRPDRSAIRLLQETLECDSKIGAAFPALMTEAGERVATEFILIEDECKRKPIDVLLRAPSCCSAQVEGVFKADAVLIRKSALLEVGGWDDNLAGTSLDLSLCLALREGQWRNVLEPAAIMLFDPCASTNPEVDAATSRKLVERWYGRFLPHALRTSDGIMRGHPWWPTGDARPSPAGQRVANEFEPSPFRAKLKGGEVPGGRCSVVIVTYNSISTIEQCTRSALDHLGTFDEITLVDNASRDGTPNLLLDLAGRDSRVRVILNERNVGFSEGCNLGMDVSKGEYIVLLNPDTVVYEGWLARMRCYFDDPSVGAVGPISNYVCGLQGYGFHLPRKAPDDLPFPEVHALVSQVNARRSVESKLLIGFCMMLRRSALTDVGLLDPELILGLDDLDISWRLRLEGYRLLIATDVFVEHKGQVSFSTEPSAVIEEMHCFSSRAFVRKLERHYGAGKVPPQQELWGIDWWELGP